MMWDHGAGPNGTGSPGGMSEWTKGYHSNTLQRGLNHLVQRNAGGAQWTWKSVTVLVDQGAAKNVMLRSMLPDIHIGNGAIQDWEGVQRTRRRAHRELRTAGQKSSGVVRKST